MGSGGERQVACHRSRNGWKRLDAPTRAFRTVVGSELTERP